GNEPRGRLDPLAFDEGVAAGRPRGAGAAGRARLGPKRSAQPRPARRQPADRAPLPDVSRPGIAPERPYTRSRMPLYEYRCERGHTFELAHRLRVVGVGDLKAAVGVDSREAEHLRLAAAPGQEVGEERREARAAHVRTQRARRLPGDERETDEGARPVEWRDDARPHRREHLLLASGAGSIVLARVAAVLAHARELERRPPGEVVLALRELHLLAVEGV